MRIVVVNQKSMIEQDAASKCHWSEKVHEIIIFVVLGSYFVGHQRSQLIELPILYTTTALIAPLRIQGIVNHKSLLLMLIIRRRGSPPSRECRAMLQLLSRPRSLALAHL